MDLDTTERPPRGFAERLRVALERRGMSPKDLEDEGLAIARTVRSWLLGESGTPKLDMIAPVAERLGVSLDYLAGLTDTPTRVGTAIIDRERVDRVLAERDPKRIAAEFADVGWFGDVGFFVTEGCETCSPRELAAACQRVADHVRAVAPRFYRAIGHARNLLDPHMEKRPKSP